MDVRDYFRMVRRQWWLILIGLAVGLAVAALVVFSTTARYASSARLFVSTPSDANSQAYQGSLFSQQRVTSYADLIKGQAVADLVIKRLGLTESAAGVAGQVSSNVVPNTVILEVTVADSSPRRAQQLAQAVADVFPTFVGQLETAPGQRVAPIKATVVAAANLPVTPVSPRPLVDFGLGMILGLLAGLGAALLREKLDTTIRTPDTLHRATGAALLGTLYFDPAARNSPLVTSQDSHAPRMEAFRVLRTNLQFVDVDRTSKVFVISSALPEEGKSTTAINLALTLAQAGQRTVLVEADLRRPRVASYLGAEQAVGLTTVLIGKVGLDEVIQPWGEAGLHVITSGATPPNPAELLQSKAMDTLLHQLRERYDIVIIDSPPLLPVTDGAVLASQADGAILVVRYGRTTRDQAVQSAQRLHSADANLVGTILNWVPERAAASYGYGYGYGYGVETPVANPVERVETPVADPVERAPRMERVESPAADPVERVDPVRHTKHHERPAVESGLIT